MNKRKIINDPVYGFITFPYEIVCDIINHQYFQRLRRIKQLGLSHMVYPGAMHTRFQHAIGAMHLTQDAIEVIRGKGHVISDEEAKAVTLAILLHDVGHGPFSHALEHTIVPSVSHEVISEMIMEKLNEDFNGELTLAINIFNNKYHKKFLHQLVSSQLDMDRLDYLMRDSFFSGVSEGVISSNRIIKMLNVKDDQLCVEEKGIYSIEKFIVARRLMYWQVYLHKTVVSAEFILVKILKRAKELAHNGHELFGSPALLYFLYNNVQLSDFKNSETLATFTKLDDFDILGAIKVWIDHKDTILATLCDALINRKLFMIETSKEQVELEKIQKITAKIMKHYLITEREASYFIIVEPMVNNAYDSEVDRINILYRSGDIKDITLASDNFNISSLASPVTKYFLCYPKLFAEK